MSLSATPSEQRTTYKTTASATRTWLWGVIDFRQATFLGLTFQTYGRVEEIIAGQSVTLRITEIPGVIPQGYYQNSSQANPGVFMIRANSSNFAAIAAGANWTINYVGSSFDGNFPGARFQCPGNGTVTIPGHFVDGSLNAGTVALGTVNGPPFVNAAPAGFSLSQMGATPAPATSLQIDWTLDPDPCDGIQLPASIGLIITGQMVEEKYKYYYWIIGGLVLMLLVGFWWLRKRRKTG